MIASLAQPTRGIRALNQVITMALLFWASTYVLLAVRGAILRDDWSRLLDDNRLLVVSIGAAAYILVLRKLNEGARPTLTSVVSWITGATVTIMLIRVAADQLLFDDQQSLNAHLLWSSSWGAYFAIWVLGALAFDVPAGLPRSNAMRSSDEIPARLAAEATCDVDAEDEQSAQADTTALLIEAIVQQASNLGTLDREALAQRVLRLGGYEMADEDDWSRSQTARAQFATALAARLMER